MIRPVPPFPAVILIFLYFLRLYHLIRLSPCLGLDRTDYWELALSDRRCRMGGDAVEAVECLKSWQRYGLIAVTRDDISAVDICQGAGKRTRGCGASGQCGLVNGVASGECGLVYGVASGVMG
jgi:hypothetical protein